MPGVGTHAERRLHGAEGGRCCWGGHRRVRGLGWRCRARGGHVGSPKDGAPEACRFADIIDLDRSLHGRAHRSTSRTHSLDMVAHCAASCLSAHKLGVGALTSACAHVGSGRPLACCPSMRDGSARRRSSTHTAEVRPGFRSRTSETRECDHPLGRNTRSEGVTHLSGAISPCGGTRAAFFAASTCARYCMHFWRLLRASPPAARAWRRFCGLRDTLLTRPPLSRPAHAWSPASPTRLLLWA